MCVGPMPQGSISVLELPLRELNVQSPSIIKYFLDLVLDIPSDTIDVKSLKAIFRHQAWDELPDVMKPKVRPQFDVVTQFFLLPQTNGNLCLLKHCYIKEDKVTGRVVQDLLRGAGYEISWGTTNKKVLRKAFQWMLEQMGGTQWRKYSLTAEQKKPTSSAPAPESEGWDFIHQHGELDKSDLKQLRWIHYHINREGSPIHGWQERLVQKALDSLGNDTTVAKLTKGYDLTMSDIEPVVRDIMELVVPSLRDHSL